MKLLLDENLPGRLKRDFPEHEIFTVREKGWEGFKNGELLKLMLAEEFRVLITFDKNLEHQQNFKKHPVAVFVLTARSNQYKVLQPLVKHISKKLDNPPVGISIISENTS